MQCVFIIGLTPTLFMLAGCCYKKEDQQLQRGKRSKQTKKKKKKKGTTMYNDNIERGTSLNIKCCVSFSFLVVVDVVYFAGKKFEP